MGEGQLLTKLLKVKCQVGISIYSFFKFVIFYLLIFRKFNEITNLTMAFSS